VSLRSAKPVVARLAFEIPVRELAPQRDRDRLIGAHRLVQHKAPVLGLYGGADTGISVAQVEETKSKLQAAGKAAEFHIYHGAPHGFHADYRGS
jgi:dienelactone hydrolase